MSTQFTWTVQWMECKPQEDGHTDVVVTAGWQCTGNDGNYSGQIYGSCSFPAPSSSFTPYSELTQDQVLGWVWANGVDKAATEAKVEQQIQDQINPPVIQPPLPWAQQGV